MTIIAINWYWCIRCDLHWEQPAKEMPECPQCEDRQNPIAYGGILKQQDEAEEQS